MERNGHEASNPGERPPFQVTNRLLWKNLPEVHEVQTNAMVLQLTSREELKRLLLYGLSETTTKGRQMRRRETLKGEEVPEGI